MLIDTHTHVNFNAFREDSEEVIKRALDNNVWLINVGSQFTTSERVVKIAENYSEGVYAAVGLHPIHLRDFVVDEEELRFVSRAEKFDYNKYKKLAQHPKVVAIGEVGLDYYHIKDRATQEISDQEEEEIKEEQKQVFQEQFKLAQELGLPVIIHCREAHEDLIKILKELKEEYPQARGVIHCFNEGPEIAQRYFDLGMMISFTGLVTFLSHFDWIKDIPEDKFMVETDAPYLTPVPYRGKRNEPLYVKYIAQKIAEIREVSEEEIAALTTRNARRFFKI